MSEQALDLRRTAQIVRAHKIVVGAFAALGIVAGVAVTLYRPPMPTSAALVDVVLPLAEQGAAVSQDGSATINAALATQIVIAASNPVLEDALRAIHPAISLQTLQHRVQVTSLATSDVLSISAQAKTDAQAEATANAVATSYLRYSRKNQSAQVQTRLLERAIAATAPSLSRRLLATGGMGLLVGALIGVIAVLAFNRKDRRLRQRDEIADAIGVPVLAAIRVAHPTSAAGWTSLLTRYDPGAVDAWRLRKALQHLGLADGNLNGSGSRSGFSLEVLSFSFDSGALALGPQLAAFAASRGIPTALVVGPQTDVKGAATLRAACAAPTTPAIRSGLLRVIVRDRDRGTWPQDAALTVAIAVMDGQLPRVADAMRTTATVLGVSAGVTTAEQLARVAAAAAAAGRDITGILVADPDADDPTTGRLPQQVRAARRRGPTHMTGTTVEIR